MSVDGCSLLEGEEGGSRGWFIIYRGGAGGGKAEVGGELNDEWKEAGERGRGKHGKMACFCSISWPRGGCGGVEMERAGGNGGLTRGGGRGNLFGCLWLWICKNRSMR